MQGPLRENEEPVILPYRLVEDIEKAVRDAQDAGAVIAVGPMELPGKGTFAIYLLGGIDHGFWQLCTSPMAQPRLLTESDYGVSILSSIYDFFGRVTI